MEKTRVGIWAESLNSAKPRGVGRCARGVCAHLPSSETIEYLALSNIFYHNGLVSVETYPLDLFLAAILRGDDQAEMNRLGLYPTIMAAHSIDSLLSFECYERIWDWPLRHLGIRSACVVHDLIPFHIKEQSSDDQTPYFTRLGRVVDTADALLCNSKDILHDIIAMFPEARCKSRFAYPGNRGRAFARVRRRRNAGRPLSDTATLLMVGTVESRKNFQILLAAAKQIAAALAPDKLKIVVVGDNDQENFGDEFNYTLRDAQDAATILLPGYVDDTALLEWYHDADVFVCPSLSEGFGFPILEAMSVGLPVVASDLPCHREVGADFVRYFDPYDVDDVADKVTECLSMSPRRRAWETAQAREWADRFTWERTAADYDLVLRGIASGAAIGEATSLAQGTTDGAEKRPDSVPLPAKEGFVLSLAELLRDGDLRVQALAALMRERAAECITALALVVAVDHFTLDSVGVGQFTALDFVEHISGYLQEILVTLPPASIKIVPLGGPEHFTSTQLDIIRAVESLSLPQPELSGEQGVRSGILGTIGQVLDLDILYSTTGRIVAELASDTVRFKRAVAVSQDSAATLSAGIRFADLRNLLIPGKQVQASLSRAFHDICVHGGLAAAIGFFESPRHDVECATAAQCRQWALKQCPALENGFSCLVVATDPTDCREIYSALSSIAGSTKAEPVGSKIITVLPVDEPRAASLPPEVLSLRNPESLKTLLLVAEVVICRAGIESTSLAMELCLAAFAGKRVILVGEAVDPWVAELLESESRPNFASALEPALLHRPPQKQHDPTSLIYPHGWPAVLAGTRAYAAARPLATAELASVKRALHDARIQAWGRKLCHEHPIDHDWEKYCSYVASLPEPPVALKPRNPSRTPAARATTTFTDAVINSPLLARLRDKRVRQRAAKSVAIADQARDVRDWATAATYYRRALQTSPRQAAIWVQLGHALKGQGDLAGAEEAYHKSLLHDDSIPDTYLQLGHVLKLQCRIAAAKNAYFEALRHDAHLHFAHEELAALGYTGNMIENALAVGFLPKKPK